ncbi:MAG: methyltransferase domain-containing protein [Caldilineaceae bacterium]
MVHYGKIRAANYDIGTEQQPIIDFYLQQWRQAGSRSPVLEPMCGTGINLIPFLETGAEIDGLDASPYMLAVCRQKLLTKGLHANLYEQSLETMALPRHYGFILIPGASFGHIYDKTVAQRCLRKLWEHLQPEGKLILDVRPPDTRSQFSASGTTEFDVEDQADGSTIFSTNVWSDKEEGRIIRNWCRYERYENGQLRETEIFDYHERFYGRDEFESMLRDAGFDEIELLSGWEDGQPGRHKWLIFYGRKARMDKSPLT